MRIRLGGLRDTEAIKAAGLGINTRISPEAMVVAEDDDGSILGYAFHFRSQMHPTRYWCTVRVREESRRHGLGTALLSELARGRQANLPYYVRLPEGDPGLAWAKDLRGRVFQESPPMELDLTDQANLAWLRALPSAPDDVQIVAARNLAQDAILDAFLDAYEWVHADWSPPSSREYVTSVFGPDIRNDMDRDLSCFAVKDLGGPEQQVLAGICTFPESPQRLDAVGETIQRDIPNGTQLVAACLRHTALTAANRGYEVLAFDGYVTDKHMYPLVSAAPAVGGTRLLWMEYELLP